MSEYDVTSYGISLASLEDVFIEVNGGGKDKTSRLQAIEEQKMSDNKIRKSFDDNTPLTNEGDNKDDYVENNRSCCLTTKALLAKRFHIYKRDKFGLLCELIIPIILVIGGLCFLQVGWTTDSPPFDLNTSAYPGKQTLMINSQNVAQTENEYTPQ